LKLENILLTEDFEVKLCDLGFSKSVHYRLFQGVGTDGYKAPEIYSLNQTSNAFYAPQRDEQSNEVDINNDEMQG
jgi:serine/threonine protein kinase